MDKEYDIGPCDVYFTAKGETTATDLGNTSGGVKLAASMDTSDIEVDQELDPVDVIITKNTKTITVPLAEFTLANLKLAFPGSTIITDATDKTKMKLVVSSTAGKSLKDMAGKLLLHPTKRETADVTKDVTFWKAAPTGKLDVTYGKNDLKIINIEFTAFASDDTDTVGQVMVVGDTTAKAA